MGMFNEISEKRALMQYLNSAYFRETQWQTCMFVLQIEQGFQLQILC